MSRTLITEYAWDYHFDPGTNIVDVVINRLRNKVDSGHSQKLVHTVRGVGYVSKGLRWPPFAGGSPSGTRWRLRPRCWPSARPSISSVVRRVCGSWINGSASKRNWRVWLAQSYKVLGRIVTTTNLKPTLDPAISAYLEAARDFLSWPTAPARYSRCPMLRDP